MIPGSGGSSRRIWPTVFGNTSTSPLFTWIVKNSSADVFTFGPTVKKGAAAGCEEVGAKMLWRGAKDETSVTDEQIQQLLAEVGQYRPPMPEVQDEWDWVRLAVPLKIREETVGAWLEAEIAANTNVRLTGNEIGMVGYWRFDEAAGPAVDSGPNGFAATTTGAPDFGFSGVFADANGAVYLDGDDHFQIADDPALDLAAGTLEAWIFWDGTPGENMILNKESSYELAVRQRLIPRVAGQA